MKEELMQTKIGRLDTVVSRDLKNGYTVFVLRTGVEETVTCTGYLLDVSIGDTYEVAGEPETDKYGEHIKASEIKKLYNRVTMLKYLTSIPHIGETTAGRILDEFGESLYTEIHNKESIERLEALKGLNKEKAAAIVKHVRNDEQIRKLWEILGKYINSSYSVVQKFRKQYGNEAYQKFMKQPYETGMTIGLTYQTIDKIVHSEGIDVTNKMRVRAAIRGILQYAEQSGHTFLPYPELLYTAHRWLKTDGVEGRDISLPIVHIHLTNDCEFVYRDGDFCYLRYNYDIERRLADRIKKLNEYAKKIDCDPELLCKEAESVHGIKYADKQRDAFRLLGDGGISVITGGPGTGKTEVLKGLIYAYRRLNPGSVIKLAAPTGRASQRMKEVTGEPAQTVHRLLEFKQNGANVTHKDSSDPIDADMLVIDETSMLTLALTEKLLAAVKMGTAVLLLGDIDQLPAIGAGNVLCDLIDSGTISTVKLTKTYRQDELSNITKNKIMVREGQTALISGNDFEVIEVDEDKLTAEVNKKFSQYYDKEDIYSCQVLSPIKRRQLPASTMQLNGKIQDAVNNEIKQLSYGGVIYKVGDKIMLTRNNYDEGYFNGDLGSVIDITKFSITVQVGELIVVLADELLDDISLAYATTIHKSQGSEYDTVIVALPPTPRNMLQRCLLYTAITRAKKKVVVVTTKGTLGTAIRNNSAMNRYSFLVERLQ
jgi:exodeoxyribonuclease V alpha subunit